MITFVPTEDAPMATAAAPSAGQLLSARERAAVAFRGRLGREGNITGGGRVADHVTGFKAGWDSALEHLRVAGVLR